MQIVLMKNEHIEAIAALERICFSDPWPASAIASELTNPLSLWLTAEMNGQIAGYVGSQSVLGEADMMNLAVAPAYRRTGIAKQLLAALEQGLCCRGVHSLSLEVRCSNEAAIALYQSTGFLQVGRRLNYYHKPREDALILRKEWPL